MSVRQNNPSGGDITIGDTVINGTPNAVLFIGTGGVLAEDQPNFSWDPTNAAGTQLLVRPAAAGQKGLLLKAQASQSANIFETQISTGAIRALINSVGSFSNSFALTDSEYFGVGAGVGASNTGVGNTGIGKNSLNANTNGDANVAVGYRSLFVNTQGDSNTAIGTQALSINTTGDNNTSIGYQSLIANQTGGSNTAIGYRALFTATGSNNTATGTNSLHDTTTGISNSAYGVNALFDNIQGDYNSAYGVDSMRNNTNGDYNTGIGTSALYANTTGAQNTAIGYQAGYGDGSTANQKTTVDTYGTFLGYQASRDASIDTTTVLTNITAIGKNARVARNNSIVLGGDGADAVDIEHIGSVNNRAAEKKILYGVTTDAVTAVELTTDGAAGSGTTNRLVVPLSTALSVVVNICVKQTASANSKQMLRQFLITNNGGTTAIEGAVTTLGTDVGSVGLATVTCTITANNTDDCIKVEVNGVAATNLRYTANLISTEVLYA